MKKLLSIVLILVLSVTLLAGCGGGDTSTEEGAADSAEPIVLKWAHVSPAENDKQADAINVIIKQIEEESDGRLVIQHYPAGQLGTERELIEGVKLGTVDMATLSTGALSGIYPEILATSIPFLFPSREDAWAFFDSEAGQWLAQDMEEKTEIKVLGWAENGLRCFTTSEVQVKTPDDLKGLKIRTMENPAHMAMVESLGASPQPLPFAELYTALQQGAMDGQENPPSLIYTQGLYEVQPYLTLDYHVYDLLGVFMNPDAYNELPEDLQTLLSSKIKEFVDLERSYSRDYDARDLQAMKDKGVMVTELTPEQHALFKKATEPVVDMIRKDAGDEAVDKTLAEVEKITGANE